MKQKVPFGVSRAQPGSWTTMSLLLHTLTCAASTELILPTTMSKLWLAAASQRQRFVVGFTHHHRDRQQASSSISTAPGHATVPFLRFSKKGDRTLTRFRLEVVPMNADNISAGCKPKIQFLCWVSGTRTPRLQLPRLVSRWSLSRCGKTFHQSRIMI